MILSAVSDRAIRRASARPTLSTLFIRATARFGFGNFGHVGGFGYLRRISRSSGFSQFDRFDLCNGNRRNASTRIHNRLSSIFIPIADFPAIRTPR
ncbi:hypothetical protein [Paraburkholderia sp. BL21I4N1]|uniref:hypothetical protein n=1 Tax=Paraburkholderia sp. BL21I4N1 TaxID=1938801 RepID=UPI0011B1D41A|nr:hypothetical protein [Paraburkholderia sp. BL21I4N1]